MVLITDIGNIVYYDLKSNAQYVKSIMKVYIYNINYSFTRLINRSNSCLFSAQILFDFFAIDIQSYFLLQY